MGGRGGHDFDGRMEQPAQCSTYLRRCPCWRPRVQPTRHAQCVDGQEQEQDQEEAVVAAGGVMQHGRIKIA